MSMQPLPPKKEVALALLERSSVHVHLDPRAAGVMVPAWFKKQPQLVLQIGLNMPVPIPDLRLDEVGLSCTLSFNRSPFHCVIPWPSVYAMVGDDGRGMVWPDDVPSEIAQQAREPAVTLARKGAAKKAGAPAAAGAEGEAPATGSVKPKKPRKRVRPSGEAAEPEARGGLVGLPAPSEKRKPATAAPQPAFEQPGGRGPAGPAAPAAPAASSRREPPRKPVNGAPRPKRELPPYLRVVK